MGNDELGVTVSFQNDNEGFFGRECPNEDCLGYFKIELGTGLKGDGLPCHCPYCGHTGSHDTFWTQDQLELAKTAAMREVQKYLNKEMSKMFKSLPKSKNSFINISWKYEPGRPIPLHRYSEKELETVLVCSECGLRYAVYGVFGYCPDCGKHNSLQIYLANLDLARKELELAEGIDSPLKGQLIADALENGVSAFDAFGRQLLAVNASVASGDVSKVSCQNLDRLNKNTVRMFGLDLESLLDGSEWKLLVAAFQNRHVLAHRGGVIDQQYVNAVGCSTAMVGHKLKIDASEIKAMLDSLTKLGTAMSDFFEKPVDSKKH
jgi:hypothetical protein